MSSQMLLYVFMFVFVEIICGKQIKQWFDYIIIGAGTGGSMVASELAINFPNKDILIIEEGYYARVNPNIDNPIKQTMLWSDPTIDRSYYTIEQSQLNNRKIFQPRAKVTGGCNSHNGQTWILANENDFNRWGNIDGWTLDDILPIWDEIESIGFHGFQLNYDNIWMQRFINASESLGYNFNPNWNDLKNGGSQEGVTPWIYQSLKINDSYSLRRTSWIDFIEPLLLQPNKYNNLYIKILTRANKILLSNNQNNKAKAVGVETYDIGTFETINYYAKKEIIISAGVYDTPKLLQLSGIGDCNELETLFDIECKVNVAGVGKNLQDHLATVVLSPPIIDTNLLINQLPQERTSVLFWGTLALSQNGFLMQALIPIDLGDNSWTIASITAYNQLQSRGYVTLRDNDPNSRPIIDHNYLDNNTNDQETVINGIKLARQLLYDTGVFDGLIEEKENEISPGYGVQSDEKLLEFAKNSIDSVYHPAGTCKMGNDFESDEMVVVNSRLQVKNVDNLRIADASIMPFVISANTNQMTMVIGKKAGKIIIQDS